MGKADRYCCPSFQAEETKAKFPQPISGSGRLRTQLPRRLALSLFGKWHHECQLVKQKHHPESQHLLLPYSWCTWWLVLLCPCGLCAHRARLAHPPLPFCRVLLYPRCCLTRRGKPWRNPAGWSAAPAASVTLLTIPWRRCVCLVELWPLLSLCALRVSREVRDSGVYWRP